MKKLWVIVGAALLLDASSSALAYRYTCREWNNAEHSSQDGFNEGVMDMTAGLLCFVGHEACACLQDTWSTAAFDAASRIATCAAEDDGVAWGHAFQAAQDACPPGTPGAIPGAFSRTCGEWQADFPQRRPRSRP